MNDTTLQNDTAEVQGSGPLGAPTTYEYRRVECGQDELNAWGADGFHLTSAWLMEDKSGRKYVAGVMERPRLGLSERGRLVQLAGLVAEFTKHADDCELRYGQCTCGLEALLTILEAEKGIAK
jgi:hypothetical protein